MQNFCPMLYNKICIVCKEAAECLHRTILKALDATSLKGDRGIILTPSILANEFNTCKFKRNLLLTKVDQFPLAFVL